MKILLQKILYFYAKQVIKKYNPDVIGITGSVGKTSTKDAVFSVLKNNHNIRTTSKNYNNEIGVPLTILNIPEPAGKNIFKWKIIFLKVWWNLIFKTDKNYPDILILEMAADHPGDIKYLTDLAPCKIGILTAIGPSHTEFFGSVENIAKEKSHIISHLKPDGYAILNTDDKIVAGLQNKTQAQIITFSAQSVPSEAPEQSGGAESREPVASIHVENLKYESDGTGISCDIIADSSSLQNTRAEFKNILAQHQLSTLLSAIAVGLIYKIPLAQCILNLQNHKFPEHRLELKKGIKNTTLIDDTYNASPKAVKAALEILSRINCQGRRWAVLGDMLELGNLTQIEHQKVGEWVQKFKVDMFIAVGEKMTDAAVVAEQGEFALPKEKVICFDNSQQAGQFIKKEISQHDLILVKGSHSIHMEKIIDTLKDTLKVK